eukprot:30344_1
MLSIMSLSKDSSVESDCKHYIYVIGRNTSGELGLNHTNEVRELSVIHNNKHKISHIHCGSHYSIYCNYKSHQFYAAGGNHHGTCGFENKLNDIDIDAMTQRYERKQIKQLTPIKYFANNNIYIKQIFTHVESQITWWLTNNNQLYGNGYNLRGKLLGLEQYKEEQYEPILIDYIHNPIQVISVSDTGYSSGGFSLALCNTDAIVVDIWLHINGYRSIIPKDVVNVMKMFYSTGNNRIYSTLYNDTRQIDENNNNKFTLMKKFDKINIVKIAAGFNHVLWLTDDGILLASGGNWDGECGLGHRMHQTEPIPIPHFVDNDIKILDMDCGYNHNLVLTDNNNLFAFGGNGYGQCCVLNMFSNVYVPKQIKCFSNYNIKSIQCGGYHSYICTQQNEYYLFGSNSCNACLVFGYEKNKITYPHLINDIVTNGNENIKICSVHLGVDNTKVIIQEKQPQKFCKFM